MELWTKPRIDLEDERILGLLSMGLSLDCKLLVRNYLEVYHVQVKALWMSRKLEHLWKMGLVEREPRSDSFLYSINENFKEKFRTLEIKKIGR